ncbi:hypothetical protein [Haloferula sp. BvORR071]|uniref:hypothetical protein n=1 Tax=Haloferula sp. BvORR071 TaxID=1396141 RepID=UPI0005568E12|nr:hypothetical protein [Haloferula sp. BvORR071]
MSILADAVIEAIVYISTAPAGAEREDADARALESLVLTLQDCEPEEKEALKAALLRIRSAGRNDRDLLDTLEAIESDIFGDKSA